MHLHTALPEENMIPWVHSYRRYQFVDGDPADIPMLIGTGAEIWFVLSGKLYADGIPVEDGLLCLRNKGILFQQKGLTVFSVRLRAGGLPFFIKRDLTSVIDAFHPLSYIWGDMGGLLSSRVQACKNFIEQCHISENFLHSICKSGRRLEVMQDISDTIYKDSAFFSIDALSSYMRKHRSVISHGFHETQGVSIKHFHRLCRFERFLRDVLYVPDVSLSDLSLQHGYYDQAHMNRDVRLITGLSPLYLRNMYTSRFFYSARRAHVST